VTDVFKLDSWGKEGEWVICSCVFGGVIQLVVEIFYSELAFEIEERLVEALGSLGPDFLENDRNFLSYLDGSIRGLEGFESWSCVVPCKSIWGMSGRRAAALRLFDIPL